MVLWPDSERRIFATCLAFTAREMASFFPPYKVAGTIPVRRKRRAGPLPRESRAVPSSVNDSMIAFSRSESAVKTVAFRNPTVLTRRWLLVRARRAVPLRSISDRGLQKSQHDRESFVLVRARHAVPLLMKIRQRRELSTAEPTSTAK